VGQNVAVPRQPDGGLHHLLQRKLAPMPLRIGESGNRSGNTDGFVAKRAHARNHIALGVEVHIGGGLGWSLLAVVEEVDVAVGPAEEQEAATADIAGLWKHDLER